MIVSLSDRERAMIDWMFDIAGEYASDMSAEMDALYWNVLKKIKGNKFHLKENEY